jgi:hypothetical protein
LVGELAYLVTQKEWWPLAPSGDGYSVPGIRQPTYDPTPREWYKVEPPPGNELSAGFAGATAWIPNPWDLGNPFIHLYGEWVPGGANGIPWTVPPRGNWKYTKTFRKSDTDAQNYYVIEPVFYPLAPPASAPGPRRSPYSKPRVAQRVTPRFRGDFAIEVTPFGAVKVTRNPPPVRPGKNIKERKARVSPKGYRVMIGLANALGEAVEWIDKMADAAGYDSTRWRNGRTKLADKFHFLFFEDGYQNISFEDFWKAYVANEAEDRFYGRIGDFSRETAEALGLSFAPQTGLAL